MKEFLKRLHLLFCIKIPSINGIFFVIATIGLFMHLIDGTQWIICSGAVLSYKAIQKIKDLMSGNKAGS